MKKSIVLKKRFLLFIIFISLLTNIFGQDKYWQQQVNFKIEVSLNDVSHSLDGRVKMDYYNNSPDTLSFIWIHIWPNAYKNDRTAFSDQLLENGRTDFYFSSEDKKGYINRLDFKVNDVTAQIIDHPIHQDIIKLILPHPLAPKTSIKIETPFYIKLPLNFSRGGHVGKTYQITQWYPKPAVYDKLGWHPIPYLDQGEFYSEFGNYEVQITLPSNYVVAATGNLFSTSTDPTSFINNSSSKINPKLTLKYKPFLQKKSVEIYTTPSSQNNKTVIYKQNNIHDFAWFADKSFIVKTDTMHLVSGKVIKIASYFQPIQNNYWKNSLKIIKQSILTRSNYLGEYPYENMTAVQAALGFTGGMEYPTITAISPVKSAVELESILEHEVGHNWNYGILATDERTHPWMDEGINTFYDNRYYSNASNIENKESKNKLGFIERKLPDRTAIFVADNLYSRQKDQPIETSSEKFSTVNYTTIPYFKTGEWLKLLENKIGKRLFDSCMQTYYGRWQFKHPYPEDLKKIFVEISGQNLDYEFELINKKGILPDSIIKKDIKLAAFFNFNNTTKHNYVFVSPAIGTNIYDNLMLGVLIHNYTLPSERFQFFISPLYATGSKQLNGLGRLSYNWYPQHNGQNIELSLSGETFTNASFTDSINNKKYLRFSKIVPSIKYIFSKDPRSSLTKFVQWKTFFIKEQGLLFTRDTINLKDNITYPSESRYVNQLRFVIDNERALYPYKAEFKAEQSSNFLRFAFTSNYYFNYAKGGGLSLRFFAGKFLYLGDNTFIKQYQTDSYHLNMSGPNGNEDYTYSNYFTGRNEFTKFSSQQIMNRDGFFKVRTDLLSNKIGKTDDWLMATNFTTDVPKSINILSILPINIPLKFFVDIGTFAEAWKKNAPTGQFIYDAGLQLSFFKEVLQVYIPLFYSKVYSDYFKSTITGNRFFKNISFSIDIQNFKLKQLIPQIAF